MTAVVQTVDFLSSDDQIAKRLENLGFVSGESLRVLAFGPWGSEPMLVRIGNTRFALRTAEAARILVEHAE